MRKRVRVEEAVAAIAGALAVLTVVWRDWIEIVFRVDPDHHSGAAEWAVVAVLVVLSGTAWLASRVERRRARHSLRRSVPATTSGTTSP